MTDVALNGVRGREFGGFVLAVGLESRKAGVMARQVGVGGRLSGPVIFPPELTSKGNCISNQAKMVEGWSRGEREAFAKDGGFWGSEGVRRQVDDRNGGGVVGGGVIGGGGVVSGVGILGGLKFMRKFRRGVRGSGKVEVGGKRWFVGNKGWRGGKGVAKREAAASAEEIDTEIGKFVEFLLGEAIK